MARLDPQLEQLARLIGEMVAGRAYTPSELGAFSSGVSESREFAVAVTNVRRQLVGKNPQREQLVIRNESASGIEIGSENVTFGQGLSIASGAERALGDFPGEVYAVAGVAGPLDVRVREES